MSKFGINQPPPLILASGSRYRQELLARLRIPFRTELPAIDESAQVGEAPQGLVCRLARDKAAAVAARHSAGLVIGSDQLAVLDGGVCGKPGSHTQAQAQLRAQSGRTVRFLTGLCVMDVGSGRQIVDCVPCDVQFRVLDEASIDRYLRIEQPYDCAGSFKSEGLGIALFSALAGTDPTALTGLPLIRLTAMLAAFGCDVLARAEPPAC